MNKTVPTKESKAGRVGRIAPLPGSLLLLLVAAAGGWWTFDNARTAQASASRAWENVEHARKAASQIRALAQPSLQGDGTPAISAIIDQAVRGSGAGERTLRSRSVRMLGPLGDTGILRQQAHLEFADLSQEQAAKVIDSFEQSALPVWIDSADLTPSGADRWNLVIDAGWLQAGTLGSR